jgi:FHA domain
MKITRCVPLAGQTPAEPALAGQRPGSAGMTANGLVARSGGLIALTDGRDRDPDRLLRTLTEVAEAAGDGTALVLAATRAALEHGGRPAWACAGITADGDVAVLAYGTAVAAVSVDGGAEAGVSAGDSMIPVVRVFTGDTVSIRLAIGVPGAPDPRLRLDAGVVHGGGVLVTAAREVTGAACPRPDAPAAREIARHDPPPGEAVPQDGVMTRSDCVPQDGVVPQGEVTLPGDAAGGGGAVPRGEAGPRSAPHPPTMLPGPLTRAGDRLTDLAAVDLEDLPAVEPVLVDGVLCPRMHVNEPDARDCRECGIVLTEGAPRIVRRHPRPPLGVLLVDGGRRYPLDRNYVIGREPVLDGDVAAGRAAPVKISDPEGTISRLHLRVSLSGWQVEVTDLGSANGSVLQLPVGPRKLAPHEKAAIEPGARIGIGNCVIQILPLVVTGQS